MELLSVVGLEGKWQYISRFEFTFAFLRASISKTEGICIESFMFNCTDRHTWLSRLIDDFTGFREIDDGKYDWLETACGSRLSALMVKDGEVFRGHKETLRLMHSNNWALTELVYSKSHCSPAKHSFVNEFKPLGSLQPLHHHIWMPMYLNYG